MRKGTCMTAGPNHGEKSLLRRPPAWTERGPPCVQAMDSARLQQILGSMQQGGPGAYTHAGRRQALLQPAARAH